MLFKMQLFLKAGTNSNILLKDVAVHVIKSIGVFLGMIIDNS